MAGYTPLFSSLTTGTLCGKWPDIGLWPIVLSMADRHGVVDCTCAYIAGVTGLPVADVTACMKRFCEPDPGSRSDEHSGARLVLIEDHRDWGWRVVNHEKYREKARKAAYDADRTASGRDADRKRVERVSRTRPALSRALPLSDSDANTDSDTDKRGMGAAAPALGLVGGKANGTPKPDLLLHASLPVETWAEWLAFRRERRFPMTPTTLRKQLSLLVQFPTEVQREMLDQAMRSGWQGIFPPKGPGAHQPPTGGHSREVAAALARPWSKTSEELEAEARARASN